MKMFSVRKMRLLTYMKALRPWSFTASFIPVAIGNCLVYKSHGTFNINTFLATIITVLCVHAAGNLVNTYFDFIGGIDNTGSDDRTLVDGLLQPVSVAVLAAMFYVGACAVFLLLVNLSPARVEHLAVIFVCGLFCSFMYTGGLGLKYHALGDIVIVLIFGPVLVMFSYFTQAGWLSLAALIYAIPHALSVEAILLSNNTRDMNSDKQAGIITLAIVLGHSGCYKFFCLLLFVPYILYLVASVLCCPWMLLPASSLVQAFYLENRFRSNNLHMLPQEVAKLNFLMGMLYVIAIFMTPTTSLPYL